MTDPRRRSAEHTGERASRRSGNAHTRVLLLGFEPFGEFTTNPAEEITRRLDERNPEGCRVTGHVLPVRYEEAAREALALLGSERWTHVLALGLGARSIVLQVETIALNVRHSETPDNSGVVCRHQTILPDAPLAYRTTWDPAEIERILQKTGLPVRRSYHAGTYICNELMFQLLHRLHSDRLVPRFAFLHLPHPDRERSPTLSAMEAGIRSLLRR